jgi:hypothetical protein
MKKKIVILGIIILVFVGLLFVRFFLGGPEDDWICNNGQWTKHGNPSVEAPTFGCGELVFNGNDPKNISYNIEGRDVILKDGQAESSYQDGSAEKIITKIFETKEIGDLNGDGNSDTAVILTEDLGGSGTFYYAAAALRTDNGYKGTNAVLLGDRIAPQTMEIKDSEMIVNYADRNIGEDFSMPPSVGVSKYLVYLNNVLFETPEAMRLEYPLPNQEITSPLTILGKARGNWFFEASFPVMLTDWDGKIIAQGIATVKSDWMTESFVPFTATLEFARPDYKDNGSLILKKDNPSGLSQYDDALEIPIIFKR